MGKAGASLRSQLSIAAIRKLALPSNVRYGTAIYRRGGVEFIDRSPDKAVAWVGGLKGSVAAGGSQRRRTRISATKRGLTWRCSGNPKDHQVFCKHCVALALAILHRPAPSRKQTRARMLPAAR